MNLLKRLNSLNITAIGWAVVPSLSQIFSIAPDDHTYDLMWPVFCLSLTQASQAENKVFELIL